MTLPFEGFRIIELGAAVAAPYCATMCADLGAEVIKIESKRRPDNMRHASTTVPSPNGLDGGFLYNAINRNKRGVSLDLTTREAKQLFLELARTADAVVENFAAGTMEKLFGLGYETLRKERPDLIMISLSGYGATGPYKDRVAYGIVLESLAGMVQLEGYKGGRPYETPITYNDYISALHGFQLLSAALMRRGKTGKGTYIDFAEFEETLFLVPEGLFDWLVNRRERTRDGNHNDFIPIHGTYRCQGNDSWVAIAAVTEPQWRGLCNALGKGDWLTDTRLATHEGRMAQREVLEADITAWTSQRTREEATALLQQAGVPAGPAYQVNETLADPHVVARQVLAKDAMHPYTKGKHVPLTPLRLDGLPREMRFPAPIWGKDNDYLCHELLGRSKDAVEKMKARNTFY
jgi:crotonobetainyl-CoA:carnitine CoA-transferase CaiB-like acyl-CoA transferase